MATAWQASSSLIYLNYHGCNVLNEELDVSAKRHTNIGWLNAIHSRSIMRSQNFQINFQLTAFTTNFIMKSWSKILEPLLRPPQNKINFMKTFWQPLTEFYEFFVKIYINSLRIAAQRNLKNRGRKDFYFISLGRNILSKLYRMLCREYNIWIV